MVKQLEDLKLLLEVFEGSNLSVLEFDNGDFSVKFGKELSNKSLEYIKPVIEEQVVVEEVKTAKYEVKSPIVGTFYASPGPNKPEFVKVGDRVKKGQVLCIVEAMKLMNEICSPHDGVIQEICVKNEDGVEFDQILFKLN